MMLGKIIGETAIYNLFHQLCRLSLLQSTPIARLLGNITIYD